MAERHKRVTRIAEKQLKQLKQKPKRRHSTGDLYRKRIPKDRLNHRAKAIANLKGKRKSISTAIDRRKRMQYKQDGVAFKNAERKLPRNRKYTEHTVPPRIGKNRGPVRIVRDKKGNRYYTNDHYRTFRKITGMRRRNSH